MQQLVVTTGKRFTDIDGLACVIAYLELQRETSFAYCEAASFAYQEIPVVRPLAVIYGPLNNSVTNTIRNWPMNYQTNLEPGDYEFVIVDVSEVEQFPLFVEENKIIEIYDHHFGFEKQWQERLGKKAKIEPVGACATLIWEEMKKRNRQITSLAANLLYTAIVSNTLNFQASVTTERDKQAFEELKQFINLPENWVAQYYQDQEVSVYTNPEQAVAYDTKIQIIKGFKCAVGQIELWNSGDFIKEHQNEIESTLKNFETEHWFFTSPSISEGRNYIFTKSETIKNLLRGVMGIDFFGTNVGVTQKLWLRKEILKMIQ